MKYLLSIICSGIFTLGAHAQTQKDFDDYGELVFTKLITAEDYNTVDMMWISDYRDFMEAQDFENEERALREVHRINSNYEEWYSDYQNSVKKIKSYYNKAAENGAEIEYLETVYTPLDRHKDLYRVDMSFIFTTYNVQNEVRISFDAIWYKNFFWLITPFEENF